MLLSQYINANIEPILVEWEAYARTMIPPATTMTDAELRDHAHEILLEIATNMGNSQSESEREAKSKGRASKATLETYSSKHGGLRQAVGFDLVQLGAEYRSLRALVLRLWSSTIDVVDASVLEEVVRFNEGIDQSLAEAMAKYSEQVGTSRDTFLAILGHDLRSPLGALSACIELLDRKIDEGAKTRAANIAKHSLGSISGMIDDLLEYTRTRLGRGIEVNAREGNIASLCREAFDEVCAAHPTRNLVADIPDQVNVAFDAPRMRQVFTNLLVNAVHHGDPAQPVSFQVDEGPGAVVIRVKNYGTPIAPDSLQVIFDPLVQITNKKTPPHERPASSLGLGLFIAREIVVGHAGTITALSSAEAGTVFEVRLPRNQTNGAS